MQRQVEDQLGPSFSRHVYRAASPTVKPESHDPSPLCVPGGTKVVQEPIHAKSNLVAQPVGRLSELLAPQAAYQIIFVSDCLTTLKFLRYCKPDLILLDERLLHINDIELGPRLAMMKDLQDIPIYLLDADFLVAECSNPTSTAKPTASP
jgi:CheY-like chemotaxis protein